VYLICFAELMTILELLLHVVSVIVVVLLMKGGECLRIKMLIVIMAFLLTFLLVYILLARPLEPLNVFQLFLFICIIVIIAIYIIGGLWVALTAVESRRIAVVVLC